MNKRNSTLSIGAVLAASVLAFQAPVASAAGNTASTDSSATTAQSNDSQRGVPGVEMNVGKNAKDGGVPGVEMNAGRDGDQKNINTGTLGAGADTGTHRDGSSTTRPMRTDRN